MIQPWHPKWLSTRWGFAYHTCVLWASRAKIGPAEIQERWKTTVFQSVDIITVYREFVASDLSEPELAKMVVKLTPEAERKQLARHFMTPPTVFGLDHSRNTIADQMAWVFREAKMPRPEPGDEDLVGGWRLIHNCLRRAKILASSRSLTKAQIEEGPCLFVAKECEKLREAIPTLTRFEEDSELVAILKRSSEAYDDTSDACAEALRILCKSMLSTRHDAPLAVRRREAWDSATDPTERGLRMLQFDQREKEKQAGRRIRRWRP